jgi:lipopolysaccharide assembly outer membrane protein LptD (OstA)
LAAVAVAQTDPVGASPGDEAPAEAWGQAASTAQVAVVAAPEPPPPGAIEVTADRLTYDHDTGWIEGSGHVVVRNGLDTLTADHVQVNMETEDADASGHVVLTRPGGVTQGEHMSVNFGTQHGQAEALSGTAKPFRWISQSTEHVSTNTFVLRGAQVTTCCLEGKHRHFHVRAKQIVVRPGEWLRARHAVWYFGRVPSFYLPYWFKSLKETGCGWSFQPGYDSRMGAFLLSTYTCTLWPWLKTETHLDYRTMRGVGLGQDFRWHQPGSSWSGDLELYYLDDKRPLEPDENPAWHDVDNERHRIRLRHRYYPSSQDYVLLEAHHLSDADVREDFFESENRRSYQPENYVIYTHRRDSYLANILVRKRINDFYTTLERLPDLSVDVFRQEIGESRFFYEGHASAAALRYTFEEDSDAEDFDAVRGDTFHHFYRPYRWFGFLNMVPRVGYRGTWYSDTAEEEVEAPDESVTSTQTVTQVETRGGGSGARSLYEVGHEVSFKAFRVWEGHGPSARPYRHIVEPYMDYAYVVNNGLEPDENLHFDSIDSLGEEHFAVLGVRNKLQTKRGARARDIVDMNVYTIYDLDLAEGEEAVERVFFDTEIYPASWVRLDVDGRYSVPEGSLERINTRLWLWRDEAWSASLENRFKKDNSSWWSGEVDWKPNPQWRFGANVHYEAEESRLEEYGVFTQRTYDCLALRTRAEIRPAYTHSDGTEEEGEWRVTIEFWLTAFPSTRMRIR